MGQWKDVAIKLSNPKTFTCVRCGLTEEALPTGMTDLNGGTHYVYHTPKGWWNITTPYEMKLFCPDEAVTIVGGEVLERGRGE
jgi:hypothetical protein